ncbi:TetR/AcrR family transcriptional regulator [Amycolatopsis magusensis]|uniref:TetR/AcrR family transcriptional regulator n=1 Tax=Amycolatopsis magusensis TaxID=882444 RepID=UPI0024A9C488|nr:TetR/AcrR family transcriptional regulator [Amycolatopsis magusensis]MDI5979009.1 TetR/AcrR family transcriptional regulator [Amycolatopsis magusensis]
MATKAQQREETTRTLVAVARELFAAKGYGQVSLAEIVTAAGVSKGALYHYFTGKDQLFRAVLEQVHADVAARVDRAAPDADPWTQLVAGCTAFLTVTTEPEIQRIMLVDAPAVLGWETWRELDATASMHHLVEALTQLIDAGVLLRQPVAPLAHLLSGAMNEAAAWLAGSADPDRDLADTVAALTRMLESMKA